MSEAEKIKTILTKSWMDYIELENLTNASIDAGTPQNPKIWDKVVSIVGDRLLIDKTFFQEFKKQHFADSNSEASSPAESGRLSSKSDFKSVSEALPSAALRATVKIAVAFPQIYQVKKNQRIFHPLFTVDISSIFLGKFRSRGWDLTGSQALTEYSFQPVLPNLMQFYRLDESEVENLVTLEGLKVFLDTTFKHSFSTVQDFLELVELPSFSLKLKRSPYLLRFDYVRANYNLKKDLQKIGKNNMDDWLIEGHPAYEYLLGRPAYPRHQVLYFGAFPTSPPNAAQALALKHQSENSLTAVMGPPGNGKTILLLHRVAVAVVEQVYRSIVTGSEQNRLIFITSTNNRAVENVIEKFDAAGFGDRFYLWGGRKNLIQQQAIPKLVAAIDWLSTQTFDPQKSSQIAQQIVAGVSELQKLEKQDQERIAQMEAQLQHQEQLRIDIEALNRQILDLEGQTANLPDYSQYPLEAYEQILPELQRAVRSLPRRDFSQLPLQKAPWWRRIWFFCQKLWQQITKTSTKHRLQQLHRSIQAPITATLATPFPFQIPLTRESLLAAPSAVAEELERVKANFSQQSHYQLGALKQHLDKLSNQLEAVEQQLAGYPTEDFYTRFPQQYHQQQQDLFGLSWQYLQQEALRRKESVIASLKTYIDLIAPEWNYEASRKFATAWPNILRDVNLLFPVFASTLHSLRNLLPHPEVGCINQLIVDEAGMILMHQLFPALVRCQRAMVVGDPQQLEPIVPFSGSTIEQYHQSAFIERGLTEADYERYSPTVVETATAYHRAAGASGQSGDLGNGILLNEHHRCVPPIISFCDRLTNYGLTIKTPEQESKLGANLIAYHVEGSYEQHTNPQEIELIGLLINHLLDSGYCISSPHDDNTIGVISPFRAQADALRNTLQSRHPDFSSDRIGTVHTFQGGQKSVIIFSTRQCRRQDSLWFINRRPNLLNVAVSRTQELFILVGNLELLQQSGGYTRMLVEHIQQYGEVRQLS